MIQSIDPAACTGCGSCTKTCPLDVFRLETAQEQISPCMAACPAGVDIRGNHYLIQQGNLDEAARNYLAVQPFPAITGRVFFHPCESACARARVDSAVNINAVEHVLGDWAAQMPLEKPVRRHISKVAVVGSVRPVFPAPGSWPSWAILSRSSKPVRSPAACCVTASPPTVCPMTW